MATQGRYAIFNESSLNNAQNNEFILNNCLVIIDEVLHVKENGEFKPLQCVFGTYPFADQALSTKVLYIDVDGERLYKYNGSDFDTFYL